MSAMRTIELRYHMNIRGPRSGRCDASNHLAMHSVSLPFTVRFTISFALVGTSLELTAIGC